MLDSNTYKKLQKKVGSKNAEVEQYSTSFPLQAKKAEKVKREFLSLIKERRIPKLLIEQFMANDVSFHLLEKTIQAQDKIITAVRIESYGEDLLIDLHHFEASPKEVTKRAVIASLLLTFGLLLVWTGVGAIAALIGLVIGFSKSQFADGTAEKQSSRQQYKTVMETLITALDNCGLGVSAFATFQAQKSKKPPKKKGQVKNLKSEPAISRKKNSAHSQATERQPARSSDSHRRRMPASSTKTPPKQKVPSKDRLKPKRAVMTICPSCGTRVLPKSDGTCPSCQATISA